MAALPTLRTHWLTERTPTVCRLTRNDVASLLAACPGRFQVTPAGRAGTYRLLPRGVAGSIVLPGCRLVVRPKIPLRNLFFMLDPQAPPAAMDDQTVPVPGTETEGQPPVVMRPDITIEWAGRPMVVLDAKWKRWPNEATVTDDRYQMLAYGVGLGVSRALLVYPGRRDRGWNYTFGRMQVGLWSVRVVGSQSACQRSLQRLLREVRRL